MKHYAGLDLSMESTQVCIIDENGRKLVSEKEESSPEAIATLLERHGPATGPCASCSTKQPTRSSPGAGKASP